MYFPARSFHAGSQLGATGQLVLGCLALLLASCGRNGTTNPDDRRIFDRMPERYRALTETAHARKKRWADSGFSAYQYAYQRSCLRVPDWTRPIVIDIADKELGITASDVRSQP
mgnify:CR=1 FL=1|tara:strand:- start:51 stop:392 length:342 start_codon:yes stop_codon:yes gene_type:complete